jgi:predicted NAD-dependent protein-ADP-ribosyltransferase YbiA (DUF1768 family)
LHDQFQDLGYWLAAKFCHYNPDTTRSHVEIARIPNTSAAYGRQEDEFNRGFSQIGTHLKSGDVMHD